MDLNVAKNDLQGVLGRLAFSTWSAVTRDEGMTFGKIPRATFAYNTLDPIVSFNLASVKPGEFSLVDQFNKKTHGELTGKFRTLDVSGVKGLEALPSKVEVIDRSILTATGSKTLLDVYAPGTKMLSKIDSIMSTKAVRVGSPVVAAAFGLYEAGNQVYEGNNDMAIGKITGAAGGLGGFLAGAKLGAVAGAAVSGPAAPVGAAVGAVTFGVGGAFLGDKAGAVVGECLYDRAASKRDVASCLYDKVFGSSELGPRGQTSKAFGEAAAGETPPRIIQTDMQPEQSFSAPSPKPSDFAR